MKPDTKPRTNMGNRRENEEGSSERNKERNNRKREMRNRVERIAIDRKRWKDIINGPIFQVGVRN